MKLQKLVKGVTKKVSVSLRMVIIVLCILAFLIILGVASLNVTKTNLSSLDLYEAQIEDLMNQRIAFINTAAAAISSGTVSGDKYAFVDKMVASYEDVSAVYVCVEEKGVIYSDGIMTYMSGGWVPPEEFVVSERAWFKGAKETDGVFVSEPYVDEQTGNICITLAKAVYKDDSFWGVIGLDMYLDDIVSFVEESYSGGSYVFIVTNEGTLLTHPDADIALSGEKSVNINDALKGKYLKMYNNEHKNSLIFDYSGGLKLSAGEKVGETGWTIIAVTSLIRVMILIVLCTIIAVIAAEVLSIITKKTLTKSISPLFKPLENLSANVSQISNGNLGYSFEVDNKSQEVNALSNELNMTMRSLEKYIAEISLIVDGIKNQNLNITVDEDFNGDFIKIKDGLVEIIDALNESFGGIKEKASTLVEFANNLEQTSESVADSATAQSQAVLTATAEMQTLNSNMEEIAGYAANIKVNTDATNESLQQGSEEMKELVAAMDQIAACYSEVAGFLEEIDSIATQTNLLSLNASIEAARAGEVGRGFAVVAQEIQTLSDSSTKASANIADIVKKIQNTVTNGKELVKKTETTIEAGVNNSIENAKMINEIVSFVETQKNSSAEIANNLNEIAEIVENNAACAEENSAISSQVGECAQSLMDSVAQYNLK